tara:strand:+ start:744 stop:1544 length:801 start_codon:yes stop_codon:yes gene_type:complete
MSLTNKTIANTYKDLLHVDNSNHGITGTAKAVKSGNGATSALKISDDETEIRPTNAETTGALKVQAYGGSALFQVDSTNTTVKALAQYVNTNIKQFHMTTLSGYPSTNNTWTALAATTEGRALGGAFEMGTGSTPSTTYDVSSGNKAGDFVQFLWYVPFNIAIDSCNVMFGLDNATGTDCKFSVMSYTVSTANDATGLDLSAGVENCVSPATITSIGYEAGYFQNLTVSSANVDAGKVIMAFLHQADVSNADMGVNLQLVYHLRSA